MKSVTLFMDVEDVINPLADQAALEFGQLFTSCGVTAAFCVTGEKCRRLVADGRSDVIEAIAPHAEGVHTDTHSFHPSTMEMLADCTYEQGCILAAETEGRAVAAFRAAFGRDPRFWGGAGNTWSPEITNVANDLGIQAISYALTEIPGRGVHRFNRLAALPQSLSISEDEWMDDQLAAEAIERTLNFVRTYPQPWLGIFVGHPTRMRHVDYWDAGFYSGHTPAEPPLTEPVSDAKYARAKQNLGRFLDRAASEVEIITVKEALDLPWKFRPPSPAEIDYFIERTSANLRSAIGWPIHRPGLSAENIVSKTLALSNTLEVADQRE